MKLRKIIAVFMTLMITLGSFTCAFAAETGNGTDYSVKVELSGDDFAGSRVDVLNSEDDIVKSWKLTEKGDLIANLAPGSYTLREIVEINGYEMPVYNHIMVGCGNLIPYDPNPKPIQPDFIDQLPELPNYIYDDFQKWINQL